MKQRSGMKVRVGRSREIETPIAEASGKDQTDRPIKINQADSGKESKLMRLVVLWSGRARFFLSRRASKTLLVFSARRSGDANHDTSGTKCSPQEA